LDTDIDAPAAQLAMGYQLGSYSFTKYKQDAKDIDRTVAFHSDATDAAQELFTGVKVEVMGVSDMRRRNMGALMGVGKGSIHDPRLITVTYMGGNRGEDPVALVGKGITFDTGGISLKPCGNALCGGAARRECQCGRHYGHGREHASRGCHSPR